MKPQCKITIDGKLASGVFMERLISCDITDQEGSVSDSVSIELNDDPQAGIPRKGAVIRVWMGYGAALSFMGAYTVDQVRVQVFPHIMSISGKGADFKGDAKSPKSRHWDAATVADIVGDIAADLGLPAKVDAGIGSFIYPWIGQLNESPLEFLERLADRHDALFSIKDGNLVFAARGAGRNASGRALTGVVITPSTLIEGSGEATFADRTEVDAVKARWYDRAEARMETETEALDG